MERIQIDAADQTAYETMLTLEDYLAKSKLNTTHKTLARLESHKSIKAHIAIKKLS